MLDKLIIEFDKGLRTVFAPAQTLRPHPDTGLEEAGLSDLEKRHALGLMRELNRELDDLTTLARGELTVGLPPMPTHDNASATRGAYSLT